MTKGTFFRSNLVLGTIALLIALSVAVIASMQGGLALDIGGIEMTLVPQPDGSVHLSFLKLP